MTVRNMKESSKTETDFKIIFAGVTKGEWNRRNTNDQYSVSCPRYDLDYCMKLFCVSKKWWYFCTCHSVQKRDMMTCHWENSFKGLYDEKKIDYATLKMADNNLRIFFTQLMLKHDAKAFFYFKYEKKKYVSD